MSFVCVCVCVCVWSLAYGFLGRGMRESIVTCEILWSFYTCSACMHICTDASWVSIFASPMHTARAHILAACIDATLNLFFLFFLLHLNKNVSQFPTGCHTSKWDGADGRCGSQSRGLEQPKDPSSFQGHKDEEDLEEDQGCAVSMV